MYRDTRIHIPCHHVKVGDDEWFHIPGCYGAIHSPECCTCYTAGSKYEEAIQRRDAAERHIEKLVGKTQEQAKRLNDMFRRNRKLYDEIQRLEALLQ